MKIGKRELNLTALNLVIIVIVAVIGIVVGSVTTKSVVQDERQVVTQIVRESSDLSEWELLEMAIIKTESEFNQYARGTKNDLGIFQETEIFVKEVNRILGEDRYVHSEAYNISKAIEMFNIYQGSKNPKYDQDKAIYVHNPGGDAIGYATKVYTNLASIKKYEEVRKELLKYSEEHPIHQNKHKVLTIEELDSLVVNK